MTINAKPVRVSRADNILVAELNNPPVNTLSYFAGVPQKLLEAVHQVQNDETLVGMVIYGGPKCFSAGADLGEFDQDPKAQVSALRALFEELAISSKPIVCAISGPCLGGGLELALAAASRVASSDATFGFPEATVGLIPGGTGTQHLARVVSFEFGQAFVANGRTVSAEAAQNAGIVDVILASDEIKDAAIQRARALAASGDWTPIAARALKDTTEDRAIENASDWKAAKNPGPGGALTAFLGAYAGTYREGLSLEYEIFDALVSDPRSKALRYAAVAEREAPQLLQVRGQASTVSNVGVVGGGTMGRGIALACLQAGLTVNLVEAKPDAADAAEASIAKTLQSSWERGRLKAFPQDVLARLQVSTGMEVIEASDIIIEAVFEDYEVKRSVMGQIERVAPGNAIIASNTSTLDIDRIAGFLSKPERLVGTHFFSPAHIMRLLELVRGEKTSLDVLSKAISFAKQIKKVAVVAGNCDGFIGNRIMEEYLRQAYFLVEEGASPWAVDAAIEVFGMAMGPFRVMDLAGQDIGAAIRKRRAVEQPDRPYSRVPDLVCEKGRFGQKTGKGFYDYSVDKRRGTPDPYVDDLIESFRAKQRIEPREISANEIVDRCILAMTNEGAKLLSEGIAQRGSDIDVVYLNGYGFPRHKGGPMHYAESLGLEKVRARLELYSAGPNGWALKPANLLQEAAQTEASLMSFSDGAFR